MRRIEHPGPAGAVRRSVVAARVTHRALEVAPGAPLLAALVDALASTGAESAVLQLHGGIFEPFAHVLPALSKTPEHAVYFSDRHDASGAVTLRAATVSYGRRDGAPWLHCHGRWDDADGRPHCGHLLPDDAVLATPIAADAWLVDGAAFQVRRDAETRFSLFMPEAGEPAARGTAGRPALLVRLAPNEDVCTAIEALCAAHGVTSAEIRGGVGSTVGAAFEDGRRVEPFVTELLVRQGRVRPGADGAPMAEIDVCLVDHTGGIAEGRLERGANPVLVTFELLIEPD